MTGATLLSDFQLYDKKASYFWAESTQIRERSHAGTKRSHGFGGARSSGDSTALEPINQTLSPENIVSPFLASTLELATTTQVAGDKSPSLQLPLREAPSASIFA
jgi:hypothetical protein